MEVGVISVISYQLSVPLAEALGLKYGIFYFLKGRLDMANF